MEHHRKISKLFVFSGKLQDHFKEENFADASGLR